MSNKRDLDREGLEVYMLHILLATRQYFLFLGLLLMVFAASTFRFSTLIGSIAFLVAVVVLLLAVSFKFAVWTARAGAWLGTLGMRNN